MEFNLTTLTPDERERLDILATYMRRYPAQTGEIITAIFDMLLESSQFQNLSVFIDREFPDYWNE